ncbi:Fungal-specific transcription factor protein [Venustampulla echinocandica]|uniref:Fungal-specific transcription factor protein n=1 Tax=Venustampulla echinocandica TaxID=2656787 RepID=A0A370TKE3_9HELO|nr:Fungal-specific transcription factor protein [Venustampulla echinocandica]RDL35999.1 Fungal-specific transcription factor protein [Venustampulla echinocandica]
MLPGRPHSTQVQDRINRLENLVVSLMQQTVPTPHKSPSDPGYPTDLPPIPPDNGPRGDLSLPASGNDSERPRAASTEQVQHEVSPFPPDYGSIRIRESSVSYVSSAHWAAVLDSIAELRDHFEQEDESNTITSDTVQLQANFPSPQLLYSGCPMHVTPASILESLPPRPVVDRLVSRYFNVLDMTSGVPHSGKFLREYEEFWKCPQAVPIMWVGLLLGMMCLSTQFQQFFLAPANTLLVSGRSPQPSQAPENYMAVDMLRERIIQCLILGHYTNGGPYVMETLILYFMVEVFPSKDTEPGIRVLVANIVQIAIQMGYHRDAKHFPNISPFAGEMRRRIWALIVQLDFTISSQMGLPRLVKESQTDVAEPRNLADSDFNEDTAELPPSRPETEVTPTLYTLAKLRLLSVGVEVADVATEPRPYSYSHVLKLDKQIDDARDALPPSMKWEGLASSLNVPSQVIIQRIWLEVCVQRLKIALHKKFLVASRLQQQYAYSRSTCRAAAIKILELQHLVDEETQLDGRLYQSRWRVTSAFIHDFLLATSILCFYLQVHAEDQREQHISSGDTKATPVGIDKIKQLLGASLIIWLRESDASREARKAAAALRYVLGDSEANSDPFRSTRVLSGPYPRPVVAPYFPGFSDLMLGYDFPGQGLEPTYEELSWLNNDVEPWARETSFQQMNPSS